MSNLNLNYYRRNNKYYFESDLIEGKIIIREGEVVDIVIENGETEEERDELLELFRCDILYILEAESVL